MTRGLMDSGSGGTAPSVPQRGMTAPGSGAAAVARQQQLVQARQYAQAVAQEQAAQDQWKATHVAVKDGWIDKSDYDAMTPEQRQQVVAVGVAEFNRLNTAADLRAQAEFERDNMKVGDDWIPRIAYDAMSAEDKSHLQRVGLAQYQKDVEAQQQAAAALETKLANYTAPQGGYYVTQALADNTVTTGELLAAGFLKDSDVAQAEQDAQKLRVQSAVTAKLEAGGYRDASTGGYFTTDALAEGKVTADELVAAGYITSDEKAQTQEDAAKQARINTAMTKIESYKLPNDQGYDIVGILRDLPIAPGDVVLIFGPQPTDDEKTKHDKHEALKTAIALASKEREAQLAKDAPASYKRAQKAASIARTYLDFTVPFYGTHRHWNEMGEGGKLFGIGPHVSGTVLRGVSLGTDFLMIAPILGAAGKGARAVTGAAEGLEAARTARIGGALDEAVGIGVRVQKPVGMTDEAFAALKKMPLQSRLSETHLRFGEAWKQVAWPATMLESGQKVLGKGAQLAKRNVYATEIEGKLVGDVFDPKTGNILKAAEGGVHETLGGKIGRRVRVFVVNSKGEVLLGSDRMEPKGYYHIPGGHIPDPDMSPERYRMWLGKQKAGAGISLEDAARIQMESEFGLKVKDLERLPNYYGRINPHSLNGMYMFEAGPASGVDVMKWAKSGEMPEIKDFKWWDGKRSIEVGPATKQLLADYNEANHMGWDMSKVKIHPQTPEELLLRNALDNTWGERLKVGEITRTSTPTEFAIRAVTGGATGATKETGAYGKAMLGRVKGMYGSLENIIDWNKIPESTVSDAAHTIKIPLKEFDDPATALAARAKLVKALGKSGDSLVIEYGDTVMVWRRSRLMRELGGGLTHATPSGDEFIAGTIVKYKSGMPLKEQGLFFSPEPLYAFVERAAHGAMGERPTIYIATKDWIAANTETLDKIFRHQVEAEAIAPVGTKIPKPKQVLHTRLGMTGQRVDIMLQEPLSAAQMVKLKALGLVEQVQSLYSPVVYIESKSGKPLTAAQAEKLTQFLESSGEAQAARTFQAVADDPEGALRVCQSLYAPEVYVMRVQGNSEGNTVSVRRVAAQPKETAAGLLRRVERDVSRTNSRFVSRVNSRAQEISREADAARGVSGTREGVVGRTPPVSRVPGLGRGSSTPRTPAQPRVVTPARKSTVARTVTTARLTVTPRTTPTSRTFPSRSMYPWLPPKASTSEVKKILAGSVAFAMGELSGKTAYWILYPPKYGIDAGAGEGEGKAFHLGVPEGITVAPDLRSAYKTIIAKGGKVPPTIVGRIGFASYDISHGQRIKFDRPKGANVKPRLSR